MDIVSATAEHLRALAEIQGSDTCANWFTNAQLSERDYVATTSTGRASSGEGVALESEFFGSLLVSIHRAKECASLDGERGLRALGVAKLASCMCIAPGFEHTPALVERVEAVLGVRE